MGERNGNNATFPLESPTVQHFHKNRWKKGNASLSVLGGDFQQESHVCIFVLIILRLLLSYKYIYISDDHVQARRPHSLFVFEIFWLFWQPIIK